MNTSIRFLSMATAVVMLGACGGGSSSSGPATSNASFPLAQAIANFVSKDANIPLSVTGNVAGFSATGSATFSAAATVNTTFQFQSAFMRTIAITGNITSNGNTVPYGFTTQVYYTTNYEPLGQSSAGLYCVITGNATIPTSVTVGQTGTIGTANCYQDSSLNVPTGKMVSSFAVETDTATTVIVALIDKVFDTGNSLQTTSQANYQIDQSGNITFLSDAVTITSPATDLTFTAK